jgi:ubiquinone/menaquinone biosynthesis C-methylase UbiE
MPFWEIYSYFYSLSLRNLFPYTCLLEDLSDALDIKERESILDAGCGPGLVIEKVIEENKGKGISITGLDFSKRMIKYANRRCKNFSNVKLQVADLNRNLEFPDIFFDKVICSNTLYALENPHRVIFEFYRVLKPGGAVIIANPKPNAGEKEIIREHLTALKKLTPIYKKIYHILIFLLLIPVNLVVITINKVIIEKGKSKEYHFLGKEDLQKILQEVGFKSIYISSCYADQDWLVRAEK